ncbi:hypothetical protein P7K49_007058 [Saguinus oedipus]|uniref:Uncharacterized protein n=1 Tax=Saguinus oedipus TaxID=9490 RepID=A0ABQ9W468_SAGOE|nr:hypothetical protein P7K49_007058 [Saguinus oedipus]
MALARLGPWLALVSLFVAALATGVTPALAAGAGAWRGAAPWILTLSSWRSQR